MVFMNRPLTSLILTLTTVFFFNSSLLAMEEENKQHTTLKQMTREDMERWVLAQQKQFSEYEAIVTPEEKKVREVLKTPLSLNVLLLIDILTLGETKKLSLYQALNEIENDKKNDDKKYSRKLTIGDVLNDKKNISNNIVRKLYRGVLVSIEEESTFNLGKFQHLDRDKTLDQWIQGYLTLPDHIIKIVYQNGSLTDLLIKKYFDIRQDFYWVQQMGDSSYKQGMF